MAKARPKPEPTDAERHQRFVDMAREDEASEDPNAFDRASDGIAVRPVRKPRVSDDE